MADNIGERKKVESELQKSQHILYETQRIAHIGSWEMDLETGAFMCSDEMKRIWGARMIRKKIFLRLCKTKLILMTGMN